jgi:hypothetical protein
LPYKGTKTNHYAYEKFVSDTVMRNCEIKNIFCINLFEKLELKTDDTYDLSHMKPKGSSNVSDVIFQNLKNHIILD